VVGPSFFGYCEGGCGGRGRRDGGEHLQCSCNKASASQGWACPMGPHEVRVRHGGVCSSMGCGQPW